jgi:RNA polymerase sigma-70 factor, ECF subfamily
MIEDIDLITQSIKGDQAAFAQLLDRYMRSVYLLAYRYLSNSGDAEDIAQEAFFRAWKNLKSFDTTKSFKTWLFVITKNAAFDLIKKKKPISFSQMAEEDEALDAYLSPFADAPELPSAIFEKKASQAQFNETLIKLPDAYRKVLQMRYSDQMKFGEIAEVLGEPVGTVRSKHHRGLAMLRKMLLTEGDSPLATE